MKIAICDDDKNIASILKSHLLAWGKRNNQKVELTEFGSAEQFLFHYSPPLNHYDLLFLDVVMDGMSGVDLAKFIRKNDNQLPIVFLTGSKDHVLSGYDVGALHYLLKPFTRADIFKCMDKLLEQFINKEQPSLIIYSSKVMSKLSYNEIIYVESMAHYVFIHTTNTDIKLKKSISELESELSDDHFIRIQRSYIVNLKYIKDLSKSTLTLDTGQMLSVSTTRWSEVNMAFTKYHMVGA
ncbi:MAG: LytR/AlgR family response regulator transcription factor [Suipraeoptans sp.]